VLAGGAVGVGAEGLSFPQAEAASARRSATRQIERMRGHLDNAVWTAIGIPRVLNGLAPRSFVLAKPFAGRVARSFLRHPLSESPRGRLTRCRGEVESGRRARLFPLHF
jgi:hypothetical protein